VDFSGKNVSGGHNSADLELVTVAVWILFIQQTRCIQVPSTSNSRVLPGLSETRALPSLVSMIFSKPLFSTIRRHRQ
jgi:hypothetical protein